MAKRAKRAIKSNPREERNLSEYKNKKNSNVISVDFNTKSIKKIDIVPRSLNQEDMLMALEDDNIPVVIASGPAGAGKTYISALYAVKQLSEGKIKKIVLSRPNISVDDKDIGFLPGDIIEKMLPWLGGIMDALELYYSKEDIQKLLEEGKIECLPIAFCRGRSLADCIVLLDEAQGTTANSILAVLTRISTNSKLIISGDVKQTDRGDCNGLADLITKLGQHPIDGIEHIQFTTRDIQRHPIISKILKMYGQD